MAFWGNHENQQHCWGSQMNKKVKMSHGIFETIQMCILTANTFQKRKNFLESNAGYWPDKKVFMMKLWFPRSMITRFFWLWWNYDNNDQFREALLTSTLYMHNSLTVSLSKDVDLIFPIMDILRNFLESSTIHGLTYISTAKVRDAPIYHLSCFSLKMLGKRGWG